MRNAILPSISSQLYNFGNDEVQMPNLEVSPPVDSIITNVQGGGFSMESRVFNNDNQLIRGGGFAIPCESHDNYHQGYQSGTSNCDDISQQSMLFSRKRSLPQFEVALQYASKCPIEVNDLLPQKGISDLVGSETVLNKCKKNKKKNLTSSEEQWHHLVKEASKQTQEHGFPVPVKRSQKLSDKITALQKLVSPYGKTDTASVLQEASLYINLLQEQIQNLFHTLSTSYNGVRALDPQEIGEEQLDLRSRGLCLVPISSTQEVTNEDIEPHSISRKTIIPRKFNAIHTHY